jgi:hypothetical protein
MTPGGDGGGSVPGPTGWGSGGVGISALARSTVSSVAPAPRSISLAGGALRS